MILVGIKRVLAFYYVFLIVSVYIRLTQRIKWQLYVLILVSVLIAPVLSIINYLILTIYGIRIPGLYSYSLALGLLFIWVGIEKIRILSKVSSVEIMLSSIQEAIILVVTNSDISEDFYF